MSMVRGAVVGFAAAGVVLGGRVLAQLPPVRKPPPVRPPAVAAASAQVFGIKRFGVGTPVTGTQAGIGLIELNGLAPPGGVTIKLASSNPAVASVPPIITVAAGTVDQKFEITTYPVVAATAVSIVAVPEGGSGTQTASLTVVPPTLALLECKPNRIEGGTSTTCTVWLNGRTAAAADVALISAIPAVAGPQYGAVRIEPGQKTASFQLAAMPIAQSASVAITASYGGDSRTTTVYTIAAPLASLWFDNKGHVRLTAPAPAGGMRVKLASTDPSALRVPESVEVPAQEREASFPIVIHPVEQGNYSVMISASVHGFDQVLRTNKNIPRIPPSNTPSIPSSNLDRVWAQATTLSAVPFGGQTIQGYARFDRQVSEGGARVALQYSGIIGVSGPAEVKVPAGYHQESFDVKIMPCAVNPPCTVTITASHNGITKTAQITVNP